jgi:hypothetical protein
MEPAISLLSQLRFHGVGAIRLDISARQAVDLIDPRKALPPGPNLAVRMSAVGQNAKGSWRANLVRSCSNTRHHSDASERRLSAKARHLRVNEYTP